MLEPLRRFVSARAPSRAVAVQALRFVFVAMFALQVVMALLVGGVIGLLATPQGAPLQGAPAQGAAPAAGAAVGLLLPAFALLAAGLLLPRLVAARGGRRAALAAAILAAVVLAAPAWFLIFALLVGAPLAVLAASLLALLLGYGLGVVQCGSWARAALADNGPS